MKIYPHKNLTLKTLYMFIDKVYFHTVFFRPAKHCVNGTGDIHVYVMEQLNDLHKNFHGIKKACSVQLRKKLSLIVVPKVKLEKRVPRSES